MRRLVRGICEFGETGEGAFEVAVCAVIAPDGDQNIANLVLACGSDAGTGGSVGESGVVPKEAPGPCAGSEERFAVQFAIAAEIEMVIVFGLVVIIPVAELDVFGDLPFDFFGNDQ